jgi:hypothetical protein
MSKTYRVIARSIFLVAAAWMMTACTQVQTTITNVHNLPDDLTGKSVFILPTDDQSGRAEYQLYATDVSEKLKAKGMQVTEEISNADYAAFVEYSIDGGTSMTSTIPIIGQTGGGTSYQRGTVNTTSSYGYGSSTSTYRGTTTTPATYGVVGSNTVTNTVFNRRFSLSLVDIAASDAENKELVYAYEGKVVSLGTTNNFMSVSRCLINALLDNFPGISGSTKTTKIEMGKCAR